MKVITICSSANFYRQVVEIKDQLEKLGFKVIIPHTAKVMAEKSDYNVDHYKTWYKNPEDYHKKADLMRKHLAEVEKGQAILVVNNEKNGIKNYIGANVLIEMSLAFYLKKSIFLLNEVPDESKFTEEILGMEPISLHGKLDKLTSLLA